ncbi:MAG: hypothetical protein KAV00_17365 [Phycisphaerae bacterium]|nr:hypothetical protein [Phycisphaerae bacterium]
MTHVDTSCDVVIAEAVHQLRLLRCDAVAALLPFLGELAALNSPATAGTIRRAVNRLRLVRRFSQLRRQPENRGKSNRSLIIRVNREAARIAPGQCCSVRSLQKWIKAYNSLTPGGLAAGWEALIDNYGRPLKRSSNSP